MARERARVLYSGEVQGVGFRWRTSEIARGFAVTGFVRNLADRRVELVAEGERVDVQRFVETVTERMRRNVAAAETSWAAATGEFQAFSVVR